MNVDKPSSIAAADGPGYGSVARLFHWVMVVLVAVQLGAGVAVTGEGFQQSTIDALFILHKGMGVILLLLVLARVGWRLTHAAPPMPDHIPARERRIATVTHGFIYFFLVVQPVSGYVRTVGDGFPVEILDALGVPPLLPMLEIAKAMSAVHRFSSYVLVALIAIHIAEVLRHHRVERDGILARMWPPVAPRGARTGS